MLIKSKLNLGLFSLFLALQVGCAFSPAEYDGYRGYTVKHSEPKSITITYTDEAKKGDELNTANAQKACARLLKADKAMVDFKLFDANKYSKQVDFALSIPSVNSNASSFESMRAGVSVDPINTYRAAKSRRRVDFFEVSVECTRKN